MALSFRSSLNFRNSATFKTAYGGQTYSLAALSEITDSNGASNTVVDNDPAGTAVGITASATMTGYTVTYSLTNSAGGKYTINETTGVVYVGLVALAAGTDSITVQATANGQVKTKNFSITVTSSVVNTFVATSFTAGTTINVTSVAEYRAAVATAKAGSGNYDIVFTGSGTITATDTEWSTAQGGLDETSGESARYKGAFTVDGWSGSPTRMLRVRAANPQAITLKFTPPTGPQTLCAPIFSVNDSSYVIIQDLAMEGTNQATAISSGFTVIKTCDHIYFENNYIDGNLAVPITVVSDNHAGIFIQDVVTVRAANNTILAMRNNVGQNHDGEAILMYDTRFGIAEFNTITDIGGSGIYFKGDSGTPPTVLQHSNICRFNKIIKQNTRAACIEYAANAYTYSTDYVSKCYQNLCVGGKNNIFLALNSQLIKVFNNTCVDSYANDGPPYSGSIRIWTNEITASDITLTAPSTITTAGLANFSNAFQVGDQFYLWSTASNNGKLFTVSTVSATTIVTVETNLVSESIDWVTVSRWFRENDVSGNLIWNPQTASSASWKMTIGGHNPHTSYVSTDYNWHQSGIRIIKVNTTYTSLTAAKAAGHESNSVESATNPFTDSAGGDYTLHSTNYTAGDFVPDTYNINGGANMPAGCYITGTEQIGAV